ncbi:MAG: hypothetical protein Q8K12_16245 [Thiobacillus sp.]|nr:hypothetical protein [Thiobacillus sp.]
MDSLIDLPQPDVRALHAESMGTQDSVLLRWLNRPDEPEVRIKRFVGADPVDCCGCQQNGTKEAGVDAVMFTTQGVCSSDHPLTLVERTCG